MTANLEEIRMTEPMPHGDFSNSLQADHPPGFSARMIGDRLGRDDRTIRNWRAKLEKMDVDWVKPLKTPQGKYSEFCLEVLAAYQAACTTTVPMVKDGEIVFLKSGKVRLTPNKGEVLTDKKFEEMMAERYGRKSLQPHAIRPDYPPEFPSETDPENGIPQEVADGEIVDSPEEIESTALTFTAPQGRVQALEVSSQNVESAIGLYQQGQSNISSLKQYLKAQAFESGRAIGAELGAVLAAGIQAGQNEVLQGIAGIQGEEKPEATKVKRTSKKS